MSAIRRAEIRPFILSLFFLVVTAPGPLRPAFAAQETAFPTTRSCQRNETWSLPFPYSEEIAASFHSFLARELSPVRSFAEAFALRRKAGSPGEKAFAEYWISRSLYGARLIHIAYRGFSSLAAREPTEATLGPQLGALDCLTQIEGLYPALPIPQSVTRNLPRYARLAPSLGPTAVEVVRDATDLALIGELGDAKTPADSVSALLPILDGSGSSQALLAGLVAARRNDPRTTIRSLQSFLASDIPLALRRYRDTAHLLLARSFYAVGRFDAAIAQYQLISKGSNDLAMALSELAWAYLRDFRYTEAIGTAMNLRAGGLRRTFTPEAPMVMAMAMNELCQYPRSVRASNLFKKDYEAPYRWLQGWKRRGETDDLYRLAVRYLKKTGKIPDRIASEWVRSPLFISDQDRINLLIDERDSTAALSHSGSIEQNRLARKILAELSGLRGRYRKARARRKPGEPLPSDLLRALHGLREDLAHYRALQAAAPLWKSVLTRYRRQAPLMERELTDEIEADLRRRSERMSDRLEEVAENLQLVEVEIYNGASEDIIWQNAHPEFRKMARQLVEPGATPSPSKVWDWGRAPASDNDDDAGEIWEDELGSFKADLVDNCSSKDRYIALKVRRSRRPSN